MFEYIKHDHNFSNFETRMFELLYDRNPKYTSYVLNLIGILTKHRTI
jgi:hypothetical protein